MSSYKLYPKCLNNGKDGPKPIYYSSSGYLLPCCWCEGNHVEEFSEFTQAQYHISNISNMNDIVYSKAFVDFYAMLNTSPEKAPTPCKHFCSKKRKTKESIFL
jgi:hypothetical protein